MGWPLSSTLPFGVIGAITPVTHSLPTITGNAVSMIAGGNTLVVNPHPGGKRVAAEGVRRFNQAIYHDLGIDNLISLIAEPTIESADAIFNHRGVKLICVTGGPAVARAAMKARSEPSSPGRAIHPSSSTKPPISIGPPAASFKARLMTTTYCASLKKKFLSSAACSTR